MRVSSTKFCSSATGSTLSGCRSCPVDSSKRENGLLFGSIERRHFEIQLMQHFVTVIGPAFPSSSLQHTKRAMDRRRNSSGPMVCRPRLIDCVEPGRSRVFFIFAHYFSLEKAVDDHWIFAGLADRAAEGIWGLLPPSRQHHVDWPIRPANLRHWISSLHESYGKRP